MFHVKICGITSPDDAAMVARAGADAIGLNFYPNSPRSIDQTQARKIIAALPDHVVKVGLFVNATLEQVYRTFDTLGLDLIQLHGDESPEFIEQLGNRPVMRAFRIRSDRLKPVRDYMDRCRFLQHPPRLVLFDSQVCGAYGGTGTVGDWPALAAYAAAGVGPPMVLAGGLTADNVMQAIRAAQPSAVDTASGVEIAPGRKSEELVRRFVTSARQAFGLDD